MSLRGRDQSAKDGLQMFFMGIAFMEVGYAFACLIKVEASRRRLLYWLSAATWFLIFLSTVLGTIAADNRASPFLDLATKARVSQSAFVVLCFSELFMMGIAAYRFYRFETQSPVWFRAGMLVLGPVGAVLVSIVYLGITIHFPNFAPNLDPSVGLIINMTGRVCEMVFFMTSNILFLYRIIIALNIPVKAALWELFFVHEGIRMIIVTGLHIVYIAGMISWNFVYNQAVPQGFSYVYISLSIAAVFFHIVTPMEFTVFYQLSYGASRAFVDKFSRSYESCSASNNTTKSLALPGIIVSRKKRSWKRDASHHTIVLSDQEPDTV